MAKRRNEKIGSFAEALMNKKPCILITKDTGEIRIFNVGRRKFAACAKAVQKIVLGAKKRK